MLTYFLTLPAVLFTDAVFAALVALYTLATFSRRRLLLALCVTLFLISNAIYWPSPGLDLFRLIDVDHSGLYRCRCGSCSLPGSACPGPA